MAAAALALVLALAGANSEGDALSALRRSLRDPGGVLQSWDPTLVNPCTWFHVTCDRDNRVTRLLGLLLRCRRRGALFPSSSVLLRLSRGRGFAVASWLG
jgi:hypothetical protein